MGDNCCHHCEKRHFRCHSDCEEYKEFERKRDERYKAQQENYAGSYTAVDSYQIKGSYSLNHKKVCGKWVGRGHIQD